MIPYATGEVELQSTFSQFGPLMEVCSAGVGMAARGRQGRFRHALSPQHSLHYSHLSSPSTPPGFPLIHTPYYPLTTQVFMMREKDGRSKGCAFIRYFERHVPPVHPHGVAPPRTQGRSPRTPSHTGLQPRAHTRYFGRRAADAACVTLHGSMALPGAARALVVK